MGRNSRKKDPEKYIRATPATIKLLRKIMRKRTDSQDDFMFKLLELHGALDLLEDGWQKRFQASMRAGDWQLQRERHLAQKEKCAGLREADEKWKCIFGREEKTPMIRLLAENRRDALNLCEGCTLTLEPILKNKEYRERIKQLEREIEGRANVEYKIPICRAVGILSGDSTEFSRCQEHHMRAVNIKTFCKIKNAGKPCNFFEERLIGIGEKLDR